MLIDPNFIVDEHILDEITGPEPPIDVFDFVLNNKKAINYNLLLQRLVNNFNSHTKCRNFDIRSYEEYDTFGYRIEVLFQRGADPNYELPNSDTLFHKVTKSDAAIFTGLFLKYGGDPNRFNLKKENTL